MMRFNHQRVLFVNVDGFATNSCFRTESELITCWLEVRFVERIDQWIFSLVCIILDLIVK